MFSLAPAWLRHYEEFWDAVQKRNIWFIKLRYGAVVGLFAFIAVTDKFLGFNYTGYQLSVLYILTGALLLYNLVLSLIQNKVNISGDKFNPLHFSLLQICVDLAILILLVYYSGGIQTPLYMLFIFHMIIGSLILPNSVIKSIAAVVIIAFTSMLFLMHFGIIPSYHIDSVMQTRLEENPAYLWMISAVFALVIIVTVIITGNIARLLYKMEQELLETIDKLHKAEAEKQRYIMSVVHEIKTPLAAMHSYFDLILKRYLGPINEKIEDSLIKAKHRSTEAIELTDNILKLSRLKLLDHVSHDEFDIDEIIESIMRKYKTIAENKEVSIHFEDRRENKKLISGDSALLEMAFSNLLSNALKFVEEKGQVMLIMEEKDNKLEILVMDDGIGIPEKDLENIFLEFYRASNTKRKIEGTGFGLSIVKQIIERHNGAIDVKSPSMIGDERHPGASFTITLPLN